MSNLIPPEIIEDKIYLIRKHKVMLDKDLAKLYGVETRQLKRQVRRNRERFPEDFMFVLNDDEINMLVCHFGTPFKSYLGGARPFAFTEHGILMLSSVLKSKQAIQINIQIMRIFTEIRRFLSSHKELSRKLHELEQSVFSPIERSKYRHIACPPKKKIGFIVDDV